jgi:purine-nucleoside phosphorylase
MNSVENTLKTAFQYVSDRLGDWKVDLALVLGSGLGDYGQVIDVRQEISYRDIPGFPVSTAPGHKGSFLFGTLPGSDLNLAVMQGRVHYYEGYDVTDVVMPERILGLLGAKYLFLTNAAGGINPDFSAGDLMLITDQISFFVPSPLRGDNISFLGSRFPDMSEIYDRDLRVLAKDTASNLGIDLKEGVYVQTKGPNYESPAEIRMLHTMGADAVGMSTAIEAVAANHMNMKIIGISCISNLAAGISPTPLTEEEVLLAGEKVKEKFTALVSAIIKNISSLERE